MVLDTDAGPGPGNRAEAAPSTEPVDRRRLDVQGLRAVAVLVVVAYHAGLPLPGGFVGVDVFFVISGFVITGMLLRERSAHGRIRFARFYIRRFKRLTPALALMVAVTVLLSTLFLSPLGAQQSTAQTAVGAMLLLANAVIARTTGDYFDAPAETNALLHTWSLSVEEQFYLCFPLLLAGCWWLARRQGWGARRVAAVAVGGAAALSFGIAVAVSRGLELQAGEMLVGFYGPLTRVWEFGAGALLALVPGWPAARSRRGGLALGMLGAVLLVASLVLISGTTPFPGVWTLLPVAATALLIRAGGRDDNPLARVLRMPPMVRVGDWSYSIYLWHWPFIVFAGALWPNEPLALVAAAGLSFGPAVASYVWVEEPMRRMEARPASIRRLVVATIVPPLALAGLLAVAVDRGFWSATVRAHQAAVLEPHSGCYGYSPLTKPTSGKCTKNRAATGAPVYLVGDSHAQHFTEAVWAAGESLGRPVVISTATNCPVLEVELRYSAAPPTHDSSCRTFVEGTLDYLGGGDPGVVVLAASDRYWTDPEFSAGLVPNTLSTDSGAKLHIAEWALTATVKRMEEAGHEVLLVADVPRWDGSDEWSPDDCTVLSLLAPMDTCQRRMPIARVEERQGSTRKVMRAVEASLGVAVLDPWTVMCPDGYCSNHSGQVTTYRDTNHITVGQSRALADVFRVAISAVAVS